jgi:predicted nucleic acid-binding protein
VRYLVDTDVVADFLNGRRASVDLLTTLFLDGLAISVITYGEVQEGILYGRAPERQADGFAALLEDVDLLPVTREVALRFAHVSGTLRRLGQPIGALDILIAATALEHSLTLVTRNMRDFQRIEDLVLLQPPA